MGGKKFWLHASPKVGHEHACGQAHTCVHTNMHTEDLS